MVHIQKGPGSKGPKTSLKVRFFLFLFTKHKRNIIGNIYESFLILTNLSVVYGAKSTHSEHRPTCVML
jgi:hypothetical protein